MTHPKVTARASRGASSNALPRTAVLTPQCTTRMLQCSIEDHKCINIAIVAPGDDPAETAPPPPKNRLIEMLVVRYNPHSMPGNCPRGLNLIGWAPNVRRR